MKRLTLYQYFIAVFCLYHMFAVAVYSVSGTQDDALMRGMHRLCVRLQWCSANTPYRPPRYISGTLTQYVRPYVLSTSQWQRWNLFSPDPLRRIEVTMLDRQEGDQWLTYDTVSADTVAWHRRAYILKTFRRLNDEDRDEPLRERHLALSCQRFAFSEGTPVRYRRMYYVIPRGQDLQSMHWWRTWEPTWHQNIQAEIRCPAAHARTNGL